MQAIEPAIPEAREKLAESRVLNLLLGLSLPCCFMQTNNKNDRFENENARSL